MANKRIIVATAVNAAAPMAHAAGIPAFGFLSLHLMSRSRKTGVETGLMLMGLGGAAISTALLAIDIGCRIGDKLWKRPTENMAPPDFCPIMCPNQLYPYDEDDEDPMEAYDLPRSVRIRRDPAPPLVTNE